MRFKGAVIEKKKKNEKRKKKAFTQGARFL